MVVSGVRTLGDIPSNLTPQVGLEPWTLDHSSPTRYASTEHLWERHMDMVGFLSDASIIYRPKQYYNLKGERDKGSIGQRRHKTIQQQ